MSSGETSTLPFLTADLPGMPGWLKVEPEDFEVEEIPAYEPVGTGEHLFLWIEKRDVAAEQLTQHLSTALGVSVGDIGMAGLKDRRAVTRQYVSVPAEREDRLERVNTDKIRVLRSARHENKLKTGHLRANRFSILAREVPDNALELAEPIAARLRLQGFPNYFGDQRFGRENQTLERGLKLIRGEMKPRALPANRRKFLLRLSLSAVQSWLFNQALAERITAGTVRQVQTGDVMEVVASGGKFIVENAEVEQPRAEAGEIVITGPLFGPKMRKPTDAVLQAELDLLQRNRLTWNHFRDFKKQTPGSRRAYLVWPQDLTCTLEPDGLRFRFTLPSGCYATVMLREFLKLSPDVIGEG